MQTVQTFAAILTNLKLHMIITNNGYVCLLTQPDMTRQTLYLSAIQPSLFKLKIINIRIFNRITCPCVCKPVTVIYELLWWYFSLTLGTNASNHSALLDPLGQNVIYPVNKSDRWIMSVVYRTLSDGLQLT